MNQQHIHNTQQIAVLKPEHKTESFSLDQNASNELWQTSLLYKVKVLVQAQTLLEKTWKKLETEKSMVNQ